MCDCYKIGGPWIAEDPECPTHGTEAQAAEARREKGDSDILSRLKSLEHRVARLEEALDEAGIEVTGE